MAYTCYHSVAQLRSELCRFLSQVQIHGVTGPGDWLTILIGAATATSRCRYHWHPPTRWRVLRCGAGSLTGIPNLVHASSLLCAVVHRVWPTPPASGWRYSTVKRLAMQYVQRGWPIACLAIQHAGRCKCGLTDCIEPHLRIAQPPVITTPSDVEATFRTDGWAIAFLTQTFDIVVVTPQLGAHLYQLPRTHCPTALERTTRRWQFFVTSGPLLRSLVEASTRPARQPVCVTTPGTFTEASGRIRWLTPPYLTQLAAIPARRRNCVSIRHR
jgi:hypothetical protein